MLVKCADDNDVNDRQEDHRGEELKNARRTAHGFVHRMVGFVVLCSPQTFLLGIVVVGRVSEHASIGRKHWHPCFFVGGRVCRVFFNLEM